MHFGDKLKQLRKEKDWTQPQMAEAIGIEQSYLSKLENGKSLPSADTFQLIQQTFEIEIAELLEGVDSNIIHRHLRQIPEVANYLSQHQKRLFKQSKNWLVSSALFTCVGVVMLVSSYFGLIYSDTQYYYESAGVVKEGESKEVFSNYLEVHHLTQKERREQMLNMRNRLNEDYLLISEYRGNLFNIPVEGGSRTYDLIRQKEITRVENRYLAVSGLMIFLIGLFGFILERKLTRRF